MKTNYIPFCPRCKKTHILRDPDFLYNATGIPSRYICHDCGYAANVFPEARKKDLPTPTLVKKIVTPVDFTYGRFEINVIWKMVGVVLLMISAALLITERGSWIGLFILLAGLFVSWIACRKKQT